MLYSDKIHKTKLLIFYISGGGGAAQSKQRSTEILCVIMVAYFCTFFLVFKNEKFTSWASFWEQRKCRMQH